jgi:hypothetical protein
MKLLTKELTNKVPALYSTEHDTQPKAYIKFFTPWTNWTWYVCEMGQQDGDTLFFGLVDGLEKELGYFTLSELEDIKGPYGLKIERDRYFDPTPVKELM